MSTGFGGYITGSLGNFILPINNLLRFNVTKSVNSGVINWQLSANHTATLFIVEKSYDGIHFIKWQQLPANVATTRYSTTDANLQNGIQYYRLAIMEKDASKTYSAVKSIVANAATVISVSPNPVGNLLNIKLNEAQAGKLNTELINPQGQVVLAQNFNTYAGRNIMTLKTAHLPEGIYFLYCSDSKNVSTVIRVVKVE